MATNLHGNIKLVIRVLFPCSCIPKGLQVASAIAGGGLFSLPRIIIYNRWKENYMETLLLILTIGFAFFACVTAAFGIGGTGTAKKSIQGWILPLFIATLISAYLYGGIESLAVTGITTVLVALILTVAVNKRHGGLDRDRQRRRIESFDVDDFMEKMANKHVSKK